MLLTDLGQPPTPINARVELEGKALFRAIDATLLPAEAGVKRRHAGSRGNDLQLRLPRRCW